MPNVISFYHVKGVLEKLNEYSERDANFTDIFECLEAGMITPDDVNRLFELTESALGALTVLSDFLERITDSMNGRDWLDDWVTSGIIENAPK